MTDDKPLTAVDAALMLDVSTWKVRQLAHRCSVGYNIGGKSGWRFSHDEVAVMRDSMRPFVEPVPRRRRRAS